MKRIIKEKGILISIFVLFFLIIEIATFKWVHFSLLPTHFIIDISLVIGIASLAFLFKPNWLSTVYLSCIYAISLTLFLINATMYEVYFDLFSLQQLLLLGEAQAVFEFSFLSIPSIIFGSVVTVIYVSLNIIAIRLFRRKGTIKKYYPKAILPLVGVVLMLLLLFGSSSPSIERYMNLNDITIFKRANLEKYGLVGYYTKEYQLLILHNRHIPSTDTPTTNTPSTDTPATNISDPTLTPPTTEITDPDPALFGLLEGMNIITIMIESGQEFAINPYLTPNLYQLMTEGLHFANNYSENKTSVSEMLGITGNYPSGYFNPWYYDYDFSFSLPNLLKDTYITSYYHDNEPGFYSRGELMPQLGFENIYFHDDLYPGEPMWTWNGDYTLDSQTIERILPYMITTEAPFYAYWSTLSMHGPYDQGPQNIALFDELGYFEQIDQAEAEGLWTNILADYSERRQAQIRHYQAAVMDFDHAVGRIVEELTLHDLLDNTLIILYGDHFVYYDGIGLDIHGLSSDEYYKMQLYNTFFTMYNPTLTQAYLETTGSDSSRITEFTSPHVIVPTVLDLLGIHYDPNIYLGDSIFSDAEHVFYSHKLSGIFTDSLYSNDGYDIVYNRLGVDDEAITSFRHQSEIVAYRLTYITDYYTSSRHTRAPTNPDEETSGDDIN